MLRRLVAGLAPAVTIVLAGCTSSGAVDDAELTDPVVIVDGRAGAPVAEVPVISTEEQLLSYSALPLDAYSLDSDMFTIQVAEHSLLAECMAKQGFELEPSPPPGYGHTPRQPRLVEKYGVGLLAEAQEYGYVPPPKYLGAPQPPPPPPLSPARQAAFDIAMNGPVAERSADEPLVIAGGVATMQVPGFAPGSCRAQTYEALEVADHREILISNGSALVTSLMLDASQAARADSRSVAVDRDWSACMRDKGFDAPSPDESTSTYVESDPEVQIPVAIADVECNYATNYFGIRYGVESAYQQAAIEENFEALEAIAAAHRVTVERATAILNN